MAVCGSGVGASVCANKIPGVRAVLIHDHFSARQGVEDDHMNILCMGGRTVGPAVAWDLVQTFLAAEFSQAERHLRRLGKVASLEAGRSNRKSEEGVHDRRTNGSAVDQHHPHAVDRCRAAGQFRASRHADGARAARLHALEPRDAVRSARIRSGPNRDRFVLSNGHASMLLWSVLHLTETQAVECRLRAARPSLRHARRHPPLPPTRQQSARHPEYHWVSGVETTTGPLGQGVATSVGMAIAQKWLAQRYNRPGFDIFDYHIFAVCGDGCLMEGISSEAASLAGHLGLDNLCWIYDNNHITIEGNTQLAFTEDVAARFLGYGWNVLRVGDANDLDRIEHALTDFPANERAADVHHPRQPHRLRLAAQAGHGRKPTANRWARRRSA